ncbi:hypothetical protein SERLADRAFT_456983 [Serpula lacrymans var. lacrymans S7.9]|nr:uncharacterized protein SERLADRAFT_456983 [Serpula lacrymans var. lacrymans S7.9]EGO29353.1 hypothetical protein SERLADRAFT_456983 [Serpula lacrymans var. lacrymans S7.9]
MLERPNYSSNDIGTKGIRDMLEECGELISFDVLPPPHREGMVKAWAHFASPHDAQVAHDHLDGRRPNFIGRTRLSVRHVQTMSYMLPQRIYQKMEGDIAKLRCTWQGSNRVGVSVIERKFNTIAAEDSPPVLIKLSAEYIKQLSQLKLAFERIQHGDIVMQDKKPVWDDYFSRPVGISYLRNLERFHGIDIQAEPTRRTIALFGPIVQRDSARYEILGKVNHLRSQKFWDIPLAGRLIGLFVSGDLIKLQQNIGRENVVLNLEKRILTIRGNERIHQAACKAVQLAQSRHVDERRPAAAICPVCFSDAVIPIHMECGHTWCKNCLSGYLVAATGNKMFPLTCLGNDATCSQPISLTLAQNVLSASEFDALANASYWSYVHSHPNEFHHCPTPDCTQVYRSAPRDAILQCPSCLMRICPSCHVEYHDGWTCEELEAVDDKLFAEWSESHDVKNCPGCKIPIERSQGCNHMTCTRCQTHICWVCLATFPKGQGIYDHMRHEHGGIGL